jgi:hypothetical protein
VIGVLEKVAQRDRPVGSNLTARRMKPTSETYISGTVVLAIVGPGVEVSKVVTTGKGTDRSANMLEFARLALEYLVEQLESTSKI